MSITERQFLQILPNARPVACVFDPVLNQVMATARYGRRRLSLRPVTNRASRAGWSRILPGDRR